MPQNPSAKTEGKVVLVIDDMPMVRKVLRKHVEAAGHRCVDAASGNDGLRIASEQKIDLILLDVMMPETDGFKIASRIKNDPKTSDVPVILVTAKAEREDLLKGQNAGADDYVIKPFTREVILSKLKHYLNRGTLGD